MLGDMSGVTIKETRHLVLPLQTVLDAVVHFDRRNHGALLNGEAMQAEFVRGQPRDAGLNVAVRSTRDDTIEWRHLNTDELSRAIISYCRSKRIPLPFAAEKTLSITEQGAALAIENTVDLAGRNAGTDIMGRPLSYAQGYEPHALLPASKHDILV